MTIIKLTEAGQEHTAEVVKCAEVAGNFGPQIRFDLAGGDTLFVGKDAADRQLLRANFDGGEDETGALVPDYDAVAGCTLRFSRDESKKKGGAPYWGITRAEGGSGASKVPGEAPRAYQTPKPGPVSGVAQAQAAIPTKTKDELAGEKWEKIRALSHRCLRESIKQLREEDGKSALPDSHPSWDNVCSHAATIFIQATREGLAS